MVPFHIFDKIVPDCNYLIDVISINKRLEVSVFKRLKRFKIQQELAHQMIVIVISYTGGNIIESREQMLREFISTHDRALIMAQEFLVKLLDINGVCAQSFAIVS